jgi:D-glycero-alpha-D-manno-heptose 1-phosphate guanylyltransferase
VANADTWLGDGIAAISAARSPAMAVIRIANTDRYGSVSVESGRVKAFEEKTGAARPGWINSGLYHLDHTVFDDWNGGAMSMEREVFPHLAAAGALNAVPIDTTFIDIGIPDDYARFRRWVDAQRAGTP